MSEDPLYKKVADLRADGVSYDEIEEILGIYDRQKLHRAMKLARNYGYAPIFSPKVPCILEDYPTGAVRKSLESLTVDQAYWMASQIPTGSTIMEFLISLVVDAYFEDNPEE